MALHAASIQRALTRMAMRRLAVLQSGWHAAAQQEANLQLVRGRLCAHAAALPHGSGTPQHPSQQQDWLPGPCIVVQAGTAHRYATQSTQQRMRRLRRQRMNPSQIAAAIAYEEAEPSTNPEVGDEQEEDLLELPDPFAPTQAQQGKPRRRRLGVLQSVPMVAPANETLGSALKRASKVAYAAHIKNDAEKERQRAARQMDTLMKELCVPLNKYVTGFPNPDKLHPFDAALLQLTVSITAYKSVLAKVDALRKALQQTGKSYASKASNSVNKQAAISVAIEGSDAMERTYRNGARYVDDLKEIAKKLRGLPALEVGLPTLALVGAPNVGKSSLVQVLSSGTPEICNYPFTTRSIKMGHFFLDGRKHQVTDTPGLLARPDEERNKMEMLTLAALQCLPTSVLFVMDLTEECGTSVQDQWVIRQEVKERFPDKDWIDVFSKADLLGQVFSEAEALTAAGGGTGSVDSPAHLAAVLPDALRVSSTTQEGIPVLQSQIVRMFFLEAQKQASEAGTGTQQAESDSTPASTS